MAINYLGPVPPVRRDPLTLEQFYKQPYFKHNEENGITVDVNISKLRRPGVGVEINLWEIVDPTDDPEWVEIPTHDQAFRFINNVAVPASPDEDSVPVTKFWKHLDFSQALELFKAGYFMTRQAFEDNEFNHIHHLYYVPLHTLDSPNPDHFRLRVAIPDESVAVGYMEPGIDWTPDHADMFAKDWMAIQGHDPFREETTTTNKE